MLTTEALEDYLRPLNPDQAEGIRAVRSLIQEHNPTLTEGVDEGKWFGGMLVYHTPDGVFVYALGPRSGGYTSFHMMPYYASATLQERHGPALKKFLTGKSCIKFKHFADLPERVLPDIMGSAISVVTVALEMRARRKK